MKSTVEWLDAVRTAKELTSDYQLAQHWNVSRATISKYRGGHEFLSEDMAEKVAADLGEPLQYVLACAAAERAKNTAARAAWMKAAARLATAAAVVGVAVIATEPLYQTSPLLHLAAGDFQTLCIM